MREAMGDLGQAIAVAALEFLGDLQMQCRARRGKHAAVQRVAHQRVLEHKISAGCVTMNEIECLHGRETLLGFLGGNRRQQVGGEPAADHGRRLQQLAVRGVEGVNACGEQCLDACRHDGGHGGAVEVAACCALASESAFRQVTRDLFGEQGVAVSAFGDELQQRRRRRDLTQARLDDV